jgi:hypothetical protein
MDEEGIHKICLLTTEILFFKKQSNSSETLNSSFSSIDTMMSEMLSEIDQLHHQYKDENQNIKGALADFKGALISLLSSIEMADQFFQHSQQKAIESMNSNSLPCQILATNIRLISTLYLYGYLSTTTPPSPHRHRHLSLEEAEGNTSQIFFNIFNDFLILPLVQQSLLLEFDHHQHTFEHLWRRFITDSSSSTRARASSGGGDGGTGSALAEYYHSDITHEVHLLQSIFQTYANHEYRLIPPSHSSPSTSSASLKEGRQIQLCDLQLMVGHHQHINSMVLSVKADHTHHLITASSDQTIKLWTLDHQQEAMTMTWTGHQAPITTLALSEDYLYSCDELGYLKIWDLEILTEISSNLTRSQVVTSLSISSDQIYCGYQDGQILSLDIDSYHEISSFKAHSGPVNQLVVYQNFLISSGKIVKIWDRTQTAIGTRASSPCDLILKLRGHDHGVTSLLIKDDLLYTAARSIRQWDLKNSFQFVGEFKKHSHEIRGLLVEEEGRRLYSVAHVIRVWDLSSYQLVHILSGYTSPIKTIALYDRKIYTACEARSEIQVRRLEY